MTGPSLPPILQPDMPAEGGDMLDICQGCQSSIFFAVGVNEPTELVLVVGLRLSGQLSAASPAPGACLRPSRR
jgi:hypothetical protein